MKSKTQNPKYTFINKALFFPEKGILVIGDLHIGYEAMLRQSGILIPEHQVKDIIQDIKDIFKELEKNKNEIKKIIFIGDIKHSFGFEFQEKNEFQEVIEFLGDLLPKENIILIKGNHDTIDYTSEGNIKTYHIEEDIAFVHGDKECKEIFIPKVKTVVIGHLHPSVIFKSGAKKEAYKCFLDGKSRGKNIIILPSFLDFIEGTPVNNYKDYYMEYFSVIPKKDILKCDILSHTKVWSFLCPA